MAARWTCPLIALLLIGVLGLFQYCQQSADAQVTYTVIDKNNPTGKIAYDWEGLDINGAPIPVTFSEFIFRVHPPPNPPPEPIRLKTSVPPVEGANEYLSKLILASITPGQWQLNARAQSTAGIFSEEGNSLFLRVTDEKKPDALKRLRVVGN